MHTNSPNTRRWLRDLAAVGTVLAATMFVFDVAGLISVDALPAGTPPAPGMTLSPASGDSSTEMTLSLTSPDNVCPGDTATGNYRWNTFMVPSSVDVGTLTYNNQGPIAPAGVTVRPLFSAIGGSSLVNKSTAVQTGQIVGTSTVSFAVFSAGNIAPGAYKIGYSCTKPPALGQPAQTERFWQVEITVAESATGGPAQISWTNGAVPPTTTTPAATSTTAGTGTTTTLVPTSTTTGTGTTTTTVPVDGTTTTTVATGGTTTTTLATDGSTTTTAAATTTTAAETTTTAAATTTTAAATTTTAAATTTTVARVTTTTAAVTTTTARPATTTTAPRATTTTAAAATTTSLVASAGATTTIPTPVQPVATLPFNGGGGSLPVTGSNHTIRALFWALLVVVLGRAALVLSRPTGSTPQRR